MEGKENRGASGRVRGRGRSGNDRNQQDQDQGYRAQYHRGRGSGRNQPEQGHRGQRQGAGGNGRNQQQQGEGYRAQYPAIGARGRGLGTHPGGHGNRSPVPGDQQQPPSGSGGGGVRQSPVIGKTVWTGGSWGQFFSSPSSSSTGQPQYQKSQSPPYQSPLPTDQAQLNVQSLTISEPKPSPSGEKPKNRSVPMKRPLHDSENRAGKLVNLRANHFLVKFNPEGIIRHYDLDVKPNENQLLKKPIPHGVMCLIKDKLFSDKSLGFPVDMVAYDGEKNIFSADLLSTEEFEVNLSNGKDGSARSYTCTIKLVNELNLSRLEAYLHGDPSYIPRDILQAMDLVMKENPSKHRVLVGRSFYPKDYGEKDLDRGIAVYKGFQLPLKLTAQGLASCLDYSVLPLYKPLTVLDFLKARIDGFQKAEDVVKWKRKVESVLKGLKVRVTHRRTNQKYTISELTQETTRELSFQDQDAEGSTIKIVDYFLERYNKKITYLDIPCLSLGKANKKNYIPMEFCVLVEGQRCSKENAAVLLKKMPLDSPTKREKTICKMVQAEDGPSGTVAEKFQIEIDNDMTRVEGRILDAPVLKLGGGNGTTDKETCQWNFRGKSLVNGKPVKHWALIDFTSSCPSKLLDQKRLINSLKNSSQKLGMHMEDPFVHHCSTGMHELSSVSKIDGLLRKVIRDAKDTKLQIIVCVMTEQHFGYTYLKWVSEKKIGVVTQCCLSSHANKVGNQQYLVNLCLKINAKLGGSNVELDTMLPGFPNGDKVMFIGADVNHPAAGNSTCPSIAAVVGSINWPGANRYAARIQPQQHRKEQIVNFGTICLDLVNTFAQFNQVRPQTILVFRDGVSEGQFDMVLNEELRDLKEAFRKYNYQPRITLVVAQKRHQTRLFLDDSLKSDVRKNVPPGTVVDTKIVHPFEFDFYLCSHYGSLGTSKPTHYYVLWDENAFTSDNLQELIYHLCFTYARCTKPVSLVPPVYYADLAAYRGRLFQEVAKEETVASSSSPSSAASFDKKFYTVHEDLKNEMYFI